MSGNLLTISRNVDLQAMNTLAVPAVAEYFTEIKNESDFSLLLNYLSDNKKPILLLGSGSNVILPEHISGLVVKISTQAREVISETDDDIVVRFAAGENWHSIVMWSVEQGLYGIENLALIPGTIGAAPLQNIGAYGVELKDTCESVEGFLIETGKKIELSGSDCEFAYRDSVFKHRLKDRVLISHVTLRLSKIKHIQADYPALRNKLIELKIDETELTSTELANAVIAIRESKLPDPSKIPNAGSFFKNPIIKESQLRLIKKRFPNVVSYPAGEGMAKLAAGWLLDNAGWRGKKVDDIAMHDQQALVLVNPERMTSAKIMAFAKMVKNSIREQYGVELEIEPKVVM